MEIEVVEFYPKKVEREQMLLKGSLHVYLIDWQADLRGIFVHRIKDQWRFFLPFGWGIDLETTQEVRYPILSLTDGEKHRKLVSNIRKQGKEYIMENYKDLL